MFLNRDQDFPSNVGVQVSDTRGFVCTMERRLIKVKLKMLLSLSSFQ